MDFTPQIEPAKGVLLIASSGLRDPNFSRTVILLCEHQAEGTFGLVLNMRLPVRLADLAIDDLGFDTSLFRGGPVQENTLHFIHRRADLARGSQEVLPGVYWGGDFSQVQEYLSNGLATEDDFRFFMGYSGWGKGQLAGEIEQESWYLRQAKPELVFADDSERLWHDALESMGGQYQMVSNFPQDPRLN